MAALSAPGSAEAPFSFDAMPGRLPKDVVPRSYTIAIVPDVEHATLTGSASVIVNVRRATKRIVFNALDLTIRGAQADGKPAAVTLDPKTQTGTLALQNALSPGAHRIAFTYAGRMRSSPEGLFLQRFRTPAGERKMISTQFESTDARRMFPSWDEPAFRATYQLTATIPAGWSALSNTPIVAERRNGTTKTVTFARTPPMPSYLVEFTAGDYAAASSAGARVKQSVWGPRGREGEGRYALAASEQILPYFETYFGQQFPLPKLDHIAVPGGFSGAMENWGAITYNDQLLLANASTSEGQRETIYSVMAHEMAHQWFGDLVTMGWWDDIWLNESFASWMGTKATDHFNPSWHWWQNQDGIKEIAMNADARTTAHAIQQHVLSELDVEAAFDAEITYNKGQMFLRMLEAYVGEDAFRSGLRTYMQRHRYSNTTTADLWRALADTSGKPVASLAASWTEQPGFPLVRVAASCDGAGRRTATLTQNRFLLKGTDANHALWTVPVGIASGAGPSRYVLLTGRTATVAAGRCGETLRANVRNAGYYRVAYDARTAAGNARQFARIPDDDKIGMLEDTFELVRAGAAPLPQYLALAGALGRSRNPSAWESVLRSVGLIELDERGHPGHDRFLAYARALVHPLYQDLGWSEKPGEAQDTHTLRQQLIAALGQWDDPAVIAAATTRFDRLRTNPKQLTPDDQALVATIVATHADETRFEQLHEMAKHAPDETTANRYYGALTAVADSKLAARVLDIAISDEIPPQRASARNGMVNAVAARNPQLAWEFFKAHQTQLYAPLSAFQRTLGLSAVPQIFWRGVPLNEIVAYVSKELPPEAKPYLHKGVERAQFGRAFSDRVVPAMDVFLASGQYEVRH